MVEDQEFIFADDFTFGTTAAAPTRTPTPPPNSCIGDCDDARTVTINELVLGVNLALGFVSVEECVAFDANGDGLVTINELIAGVANTLNGCAA